MTIMKESPSSPSLFVNLIDTELNKKITRSSKKDPLVLNALQALEGEVPTQFRSQLSDESYDSGILAFQGWVFLPDRVNIRHDIVKLCHDTPATWRLTSLFQPAIGDQGWPNVRKYVEGCSVFQQNKTSTHPMVPPLNHIPLEQTLLFKQISYNLIMGLPISNGFNALLVVVDHGLSR